MHGSMDVKYTIVNLEKITRNITLKVVFYLPENIWHLQYERAGVGLTYALAKLRAGLSGVRVNAGASDVSVLNTAQTGCGTHPTPYSMWTLFRTRGKAVGLAPTLRMSGAMPLLREQEHDIQSAWIYLNIACTLHCVEISVFARVISAPAYFAHPNFQRMILNLFFLRVFHAPSYCSFTSNLTMFSLIIDY